jgi:hypothetical protein
MQKTKIIIALVTVAMLTLTIVGLASAQISASQTYPGTSPNNGFWGWMGSCFGLRNNQPSANQYVAPPASANSPVPTPSQGNGNYYGFGSCWARINSSP